MSYQVCVRTMRGVRWLAYGTLRRVQSHGTRYSHISAAIQSIEGFARRREEQYTFTIEHADGHRQEYTPIEYRRLQLTFKIVPLENGAFRIYSREASCEMVATDLPSALSKVAYDWAEQVEADL